MLVDNVQNEPLLEKERAGFVDAKVANASRFHSSVTGFTCASKPALAAFVEASRVASISKGPGTTGAGTSCNAANDTMKLASKGVSARSNPESTHGPSTFCRRSKSRSRIAGFTPRGFHLSIRFKIDIFISYCPSSSFSSSSSIYLS